MVAGGRKRGVGGMLGHGSRTEPLLPRWRECRQENCRACIQAFWERGAAEEERVLEQGEGRRKRGYNIIGLDIDGQIHA